MNYLDIAILVFVGLFFLYGLLKGFVKPIISIIGFGGAIALIYFTSKPFGNILMNSFIGDWVGGWFSGLVEKLGDNANAIVVESPNGLVLSGTSVLVTTVLAESLGIPSFMLGGFVNNMQAGIALGENFTNSCKLYVGILFASIIIIIGVAIVVTILKIILHKALAQDGISMINRGLGGLLYMILGVLVASVIIYIMSYIVGLLNTPTAIQIKEMMGEDSVIAKYFVEYNPIKLIIDAVTNKG